MALAQAVRLLGIAAATVGLAGLLLSGCGGGALSGGVNGGNGGNTNGAGAGITAPPSPSRGACAANPAHNDGRARWTVLVYMNSANNLEADSFLNVAQMAAVGSDSSVNIVLQWKQIESAQVQNKNPGENDTPSFVGTHRYFIRQHGAADVNRILNNRNTTSLEDAQERLPDPGTNVAESDPVTGQTISTSDMGNVASLTDFIRWGTQHYPADNLAVVIWDHGSGWRDVYNTVATRKRVTRAVSQDDDTGNEIETWQIPSALAAAQQRIDALIFDASLEQMVEVAYQMRNSARIMVGSEESPPGTGYPYDKWLNDLKASGKNPCDLGTSIVTEFVTAYAGSKRITQSYLDLSQMKNVAAALDTFGKALNGSGAQALISSARNKAYHYEPGSGLYGDYVDLYHFTDLIGSGTNQAALYQAANSLKAALVDPSRGAILQAGGGAADEANSHGLSAYIPSPANGWVSTYDNLSLATDAPNWRQFVFVESYTQ